MDKTTSVDAIFRVAFSIESSAIREEYLQQACGEDHSLRNRVTALLQSQEEAPEFLESPRATVDLPPISERPGSTIGPYKLLQEIGEGGMGAVYMAHQRAPVRRKVALKIIKPGMDIKEVIARFQAEEQALAMMDHPNIAKVYDAGTTESGRPYFVMELVSGVPITEYADDNNLTTDQRLALLVLVCNAVQHAHQKGIIHRDIKPSNILVTLHDGVPVPKIIDFGIAKAINQELTATTICTGLGQMVGTPMYMSPEQAERSGFDVDTRSDIYSLGVLLYELLTGTPPFDQEQLKEAGLDEMRRMIREQEPQRPSTRLSTMGEEAMAISERRKTSPVELSHSLRQELDWIVMKALEKDRTRRYETATDFSRDIQRYLNDEPVFACPPSNWYRLSKLTRRNRTAVATTLAIALALVVGAGVAAGQAYRATKAEQFANDQLAIARAQKRLAKEQEQLADAAAKREHDLRQVAESARKEAETVTEFLVELFRSPDPEQNGREITVAEMLDDATHRIATEFSQDRPLQAKLRKAIGETYSALGLPREAISQLEVAYDLYRNTFGKGHRTTIGAANLLALARKSVGNYAEARQLAEESATAASDAFGLTDELTLESQHIAAMTLIHSPKTDSLNKAIEKLIELLPLYQEHFGVEHDKTITLMNDLAYCYGEAGQRQQSIELHEKAYAICQHRPDVNADIVLMLMHNLGAQYGVERGTPLLEKALELEMDRYGPNHSNTLHTMSFLTKYYFQAGRKDEMIAMALRRWTGALASMGLENPETIAAGTTLLWAYGEEGRLDDILEMSQEHFSVTALRNLPDDSRIRAFVYRLAFCLRTYAPERATELFNFLAAWDTDPGMDLSNSLQSKMVSAKAHSELGRHSESVRILEEVLTVAEQHHCPWELYYDSAVIYSRAGKLRDALTMLDKALAFVRRPIPTPIGEKLYTRRAEVNLGLGNIEESLADANQYLALARAAQPPDHHAQIAKMVRAELLLLTGRDEEYRHVCHDIVIRYCDKKNPSEFEFVIRALVLAANAIPDPHVAVELASKTNPSNASRLHTRAMAHLRAGQIDAAVEHFHVSLKAGPGWHARYLNWLGLSIACQHLKKPKEAKAWLERAAEQMDAHPGQWAQKRLERQILRLEAEGLLETPIESDSDTAQQQNN